MENRERKLTIRNLKISFRTDGGKVQAVRDINFDLYKGETLAIVGESGSGKSVTSRAILGILAGNAIKDGGEILYDGQDLMKISEEDFCKIRGDKIAMIFQDPLSSLNPIMRIGKQMTEAMLIKGKHNQASARRDFNKMLACLNRYMDTARNNSPDAVAQDKQLCKKFDTFERKHLELENAFNAAKENCVEALSDIEDALFRIEKHAVDGLPRDIRALVKRTEHTFNKYVVEGRADELRALIAELKTQIKVPFGVAVKNFLRPLFRRNAPPVDTNNYPEIAVTLGKIKDILAEAAGYDEPNFFSMGYYLSFADKPLPDMPIAELNDFLRKYLDDNFMLEFISLAKAAIICSDAQSVERKRAAIKVIDHELEVFSKPFDKKTATASANELIAAVESAINKLDTVKDNISYTFTSSLRSAIAGYFDGISRNQKEEKRFAKQTAAFERKVAAGKTPSYKVADKNLVDLEEERADICALITRIRDSYRRYIDSTDSVDFDKCAVDMIDYLKAKASDVAYKVTNGMAKERALKLMEEVGIPEPRKRFTQYPFELSGGMRQRIVIAIALSANPDILICDEPTTALDVTIQSQILELINKVKAERNLSVIFITHDLGVVANMADRVAVMYAGKIVEIGTADDVFYSPAHPYTWALLSSMPDLDTKDRLEAIPGTPPNMIFPPKGDAFAERNKYAMQIDFEMQPPMFRISDTHYAATWLLHPNAPKIDPPKSVTDRIKRARAAAGKNAESAATEAPAEAEEQKAAESAGAAEAAETVETAETADAKPKKSAKKASGKKASGKKASDKKSDGDKEKKPKAKKPSGKKED